MSVRTDTTNFDHCPVSGKRKFVTQARAYTFLARICRKNKRKGDRHPVHVYLCPDCGHHHLGHTTQTAGQVKRPPAPKPRPPANGTARGIDHVTRQWWNVECKLIALGKVA